MLIQLVHQNAERRLLNQVEASQTGLKGALHFQCSKTGIHPSEEEVVLTVKPLLEDRDAAIYFLQDDDLVITWNGTQKSLVDTLCNNLYRRFKLSTDKSLHNYYDFHAQGEELRLLCKQKMAAVSNNPGESRIASPAAADILPATLPEPLPKQLAAFKAKLQERAQRKVSEILIVEDQRFSRQLLAGLLERNYKVHAARDARDALTLYLEHAPDAVLLDIELPDIDGHTLASSIRTYDPQSKIIMVTANNYVEDVTRAKQNGACGFIVKPYSRQKILARLEQLLSTPAVKR